MKDLSSSEILQLSRKIVQTLGNPGADFDGIVETLFETCSDLGHPVQAHLGQPFQGLTAGMTA